MHKSLFFALFTALSSCLFAQTKPDKVDNLGTRQVETYFFKETTYDSVHFTIQGKNDTVLTEELYRNGQSRYKFWRTDSSFFFNNQGLIEKKIFHLKPNNQSDSTILFYRNGHIKSVEAKERKVFYRSSDFHEDGSIKLKRADIFVGKYGKYSVQRDSLNRIFYTSFLDTVLTDRRTIWNYDTLFYQNGQPYLILIERKITALDKYENEKYKTVKCEFYDEKGNAFESIVPDSLNLIPFKDNVDCYYGLKTSNNDTIFKPRFDRIVPLEIDLWAVYEGSKCRLMRPDGRFLVTPEMDDVDKMDGNFKSINNSEHWEQWNHGERLNKSPNFNEYYQFSIGNKYGVIDNKGQLIVPPQHREINTSESSTTDSLFHFSVYAKGNVKEKTKIEEGYIHRNGASLFPNYIHTSVVSHNRYYQVSNDLKSLKESYEEGAIGNFWGLVNSRGDLLLPCIFQSIDQIDTSDFFKVRLQADNKEETEERGIFDAKNRRWLVDTSRKLSIDYIFNNAQFIVLRQEKTKKYGLINAKGETVFPFVYDSLRIISEEQQLFIAIKKNAYQFLNVSIERKKRPIYEYLEEVKLEYSFSNEHPRHFVSIFLAKNNGKWGIVDSNDQILKPFVADYAACWTDKVLLVENSTTHYFTEDAYPNEADIEDLFGTDENIYACHLAEKIEKLFFINRKGRVVIPPQYNSVSGFNDIYNNQDDYVLVEDVQKKRKLISTETGDVIDFPFPYRVVSTNKNSKLILVAEPKENVPYRRLSRMWGVVTTEGKQLTPCTNAGIAIADAKIGTYFVRQDTPKVPFFPMMNYEAMDTLGDGDNDWLWYNVEGKLIDSTAFRFPIQFNNGLGIGMKEELFGIYRPDGSIFAPPQYKNIRRDEKTGIYYLFEPQGMKMTISLKKRDGTTFVQGGRYDAVSPFYGKYALARASGKVGLIDTLGNEIIVPNDLLAFKSANLFDSLRLYDKQLTKSDKLRLLAEYGFVFQNRQMPIQFNHSPYSPDSIGLSPLLRNTVWHLMLEKIKDDAFWQTLDFDIDRSRQHVGVYYNIISSCGTGRMTDEQRRSYSGDKVIATDSMVAFALKKEYRHPLFFNFHLKNDRWNEVAINDILMIQGEKRWLFNDLLTKKVKALKDEEIDCSNASAFIAQVENRFMLKKEGIDFCFESNKKHNEFVVVSFSWAELQPYLKMRF